MLGHVRLRQVGLVDAAGRAVVAVLPEPARDLAQLAVQHHLGLAGGSEPSCTPRMAASRSASDTPLLGLHARAAVELADLQRAQLGAAET